MAGADQQDDGAHGIGYASGRANDDAWLTLGPQSGQGFERLPHGNGAGTPPGRSR